jgi:hypothetical protein
MSLLPRSAISSKVEKMGTRPDAVIDIDSKILFRGSSDAVVTWLETAYDAPRQKWVSVGETGDLLTASQYLDLAT